MSETERPGDVQSPHTLHRSADDRMLAGVCGGLADFTGLDPVIFRVAFAVSSILGGAGVVAYALAWLLIPDADQRRSHAESLLGNRDIPRVAMIVIGVIAVLILAGSLDGPFGRHSGGGGLTLVVLVAVGVWYFTREGDALARARTTPSEPSASDAATAVSSFTGTAPGGDPRVVDALVDTDADADATDIVGTTVVTPPPTGAPPRAHQPRPPRSKLFTITFSAMLVMAGLVAAVHASGAADVDVETGLALCLLVVGAGLLAGAWYGRARLLLIPLGLFLVVLTGVAAVADVPFAGGTGERQWNPADVSQLESEYRLGAGHGVLDLRAISLQDEVRRVEASIGAGELEVRLPPGTEVEVDARAGFGEVVVLGRTDDGVDVTQQRTIDGGADQGRLVLELDVGMGRVEVTR